MNLHDTIVTIANPKADVMTEAEILSWQRDLEAHNTFFAKLNNTINDIWPFSPVGRAIKKAHDSKNFLELGRLIAGEIDNYEREVIGPLEEKS